MVIAVSLTALVTSCQKDKIVITKEVYAVDYVRQRALNCDLHDSIFLDSPNGVLFQSGYAYSGYNSAFARDKDNHYQVDVEVISFVNFNMLYDVEYTNGTLSGANKIKIKIINTDQNQVFTAYSGQASYTKIATNTGYIRFCNVLFRDGAGNGSYRGIGYLYIH